MAAILLLERGALELKRRVADYWPAFGQNGKSEITVHQLVGHASGVVLLPGYESLLALDGSGFDEFETIADRLASAAPVWEPGTAQGYHGYTYGSLVSELVFQITGQRAGEFLSRNLFGPLSLNIWLGTPQREQRSVAPAIAWPEAPRTAELETEIASAMARMQAAGQASAAPPELQPGTWQYDMGFKRLFGSDPESFARNVACLWNAPGALKSEFGSANATTDARSLARLYIPLANEGRIDGRAWLSPATVAAASAPIIEGSRDLVLPFDTNWTPSSNHANWQPHPLVPPLFGPNPASIGMLGGGGQYGFADARARVTGGFIRNHYSNTMELSAHLVAELYNCL
jgi:CubicO group peptidase (beta-lactamase class C family)